MKKPEEMGSLVRPKRTRADNVKTNLQGAGEMGEGLELDLSGSRQGHKMWVIS